METLLLAGGAAAVGWLALRRGSQRPAVGGQSLGNTGISLPGTAPALNDADGIMTPVGFDPGRMTAGSDTVNRIHYINRVGFENARRMGYSGIVGLPNYATYSALETPDRVRRFNLNRGFRTGYGHTLRDLIDTPLVDREEVNPDTHWTIVLID